MDAAEIGALIRHQKDGAAVLQAVRQLPYLELEAKVQPITRAVLRMSLTLTPAFDWHDRLHGSVEPFWLWVEDAESEHIYHTEYFLLHRHACRQPHSLSFSIPVFDPVPPQYFVQCVSDRWLGSQSTLAVSFQHLILPELHPPHTALLDLHPLSRRALYDDRAEQMYRFSHFNPVQTQVFHAVYHSDQNVLLGSPTGSGKCFARGTQLRLYNGDLIAVENIRGGEQLMGDDGTPRIVTPGSLTARGSRGVLYTVTPQWEGAEAFTVNGEHILVLSNSVRPWTRGRCRLSGDVYPCGWPSGTS